MKACVLILPLLASIAGQNYCEIESCESHIGCNNTGEFGEKCVNARVVTLNSELIVQMLNEKRNEVAAGSWKSKAALRMATMRWDDELARLALLTAKTCSLQHDKCHDTQTYNYSGQAMQLKVYAGTDRFTFEEITRAIINKWSSEQADIRVKDINYYQDRAEREGDWGRFALMINDRNTHVGCGAIQYRPNSWYMFLLVCNYATNNFEGHPIYKTGEWPAILCKSGRNQRFKSLCSPEEDHSKD